MTPNFMSLWPGHVIRTMAEEHDVLLAALGDLARLDQRIAGAAEVTADDVTALHRLATLLLDAEPHHQREEQVLFPALEELGISGPPMVMRMEHEQLRAQKHALLALAERARGMTHQQLTHELHLSALGLGQDLAAHIEKENQILYPMALQHIDDDDDWAELKRACDAIGYCSFTPPAS